MSRRNGLPRFATRVAVFGALLACAVSIALISRASAALGTAGQVATGPIRQAQVLESERTGVPSPVGLAFSSTSKAFYVVGARPGGAADTEVVKLTPFGLSRVSDRAGSALIAAAVKDPVNVAFDARGGRLLLLDTADRLLEVKADANGDLDPSTLVRRDALRLELRDPQGMAVDPASGVVFILDAGATAIVRVEPTADGSFDAATTSVIDLGPSGVSGVRGLAFDPLTGHLHLHGVQGLVELSPAGAAVTTRDLSGFGLAKLEGMVFAPSGDRTDDPAALSVYVADSGGAQSSGQIVELSLAPSVAAESIEFTSTLVTTVNMGGLTPPSTDPSGITYVPSADRLLISDGEVEETVNGITHFQGANVWELNRNGLTVNRTANISNIPPAVVPVTNEPAGAGFNPTNGHYYFSADDGKEVYDVNPGADGLVGTAGDTVVSFDTLIHGNSDPEGITYDTFSGHLFVADGLNREIYRYTTGGALVGQFDTAQYGVQDPESVEFNPDSGTLFILSDTSNSGPNAPIIIETTTGGALNRTIDASASNALKPAGLAYAPASNGTGVKRFYIVDRGIDNNSDPNAVDGKLYEMTTPAAGTPANTPPVVSAGTDATIGLPASASLNGTVTDDGQLGPFSTTWSQISGPGTVTFGNASLEDTTASVPIPGIYVVRLTANDGQFSASDDVTLTFTGSGSVQSVDVRVNVSSDDAEEIAGGTVQRGDGDLDMMTDTQGTGTPKVVTGMRFNGIAIPPGASISAAYVQFQADEADTAATSLTIKGQDAVNPLTFSTAAFDITSRPTTVASASWSPADWVGIGDADLDQRSSDLAGVIQEIVNKPGWASGNSVVLLVTGSGERVAVAHNQIPAAAPLFHVEYATGSGNNPPQITSYGGGATASVSAAENQSSAADVDAVDPDAGTTLTYSKSGGADQGAFTIDTSTGILSFATAPNFESPTDSGGNNVYDVTVSVSDGNGGSDSQAIAVSVLNVNEFSPVIGSDGGGATAALARPENQTAVTDVDATDADLVTPTYAISGGADAARFAIVPATGVLTFQIAPDFENPTDFGLNNVYDVVVEASDGSLSDTQAIAVTVTDVAEGSNQPPSVNAGPDQAITLPTGATLDGTVADDGLPNPPGALTTTWTQESGPGTATFGNASMVDTTATFPLAGTYVLRLTASDTLLSEFDELTITVSSSSVQSLDVRVSVGADDAEERTDNSVVPGGNDLDMMTGDEANLVIGTRFRAITIPPGASISSAYLQFQADEVHSASTSLTIKGQAADNPPVFTTAVGNISSRPTTTASTAWTVDPWLAVDAAGPAQRSPGLAAIIQEIVSRPGWASGNSLVLLVTGSGTRIARSFNVLAGAAAPLLHVEWTTGGNQAPAVNAGSDQPVTLPANASLSGTASDDGLPNPPGILTTTWSETSGPGTVTFGDASAVATTASFSQAGTYVLRLTASDSDFAPFDELTVTVSDPAPPGSPLYFSLLDLATVGGVTADNEDVVFFDGTSFSLAFDGTDVSLSTLRIDAFSWIDADSLLLSFDQPGTVPVVGSVDDSDIVRFDATSLGSTTAGTFSLYFDGSDVGLTTNNEDVDAVELLPNGHIVISTTGTVSATGAAGEDEDLLEFVHTSLGAVTAGTFTMYFEGSDVLLTAGSEDVDAAAVDGTGKIYLSTTGNFTVTNASGADEDVFVFTPTTLGGTTSGTFSSTLYFGGSVHGLAANDVLAIDLP